MATAKKKPESKEPAVLDAPKEGSKAPDFALTADDETQVKLSAFKGKKVVLYFYPKDDTPGCTVEACGFRDLYKKIAAKGGVVLGVSRDSVAKHQKFKAKYDLNFPLLSDPDGDVISAYGAWGPKVFMGRKFNGIKRTTFIIGENGKIEKAFPKVATKTHAQEILDAL